MSPSHECSILNSANCKRKVSKCLKASPKHPVPTSALVTISAEPSDASKESNAQFPTNHSGTSTSSPTSKLYSIASPSKGLDFSIFRRNLLKHCTPKPNDLSQMPKESANRRVEVAASATGALSSVPQRRDNHSAVAEKNTECSNFK